MIKIKIYENKLLKTQKNTVINRNYQLSDF